MMNKQMMEMVDMQSPIKPPNDPLTLDELREMDGEPVWVVRSGRISRWYLVDVAWKAKNLIYLYAAHSYALFAKEILADGAKIYRCKPEPSEE